MLIALWILNAFLALAFIGAGAMKLLTPTSKLGAQERMAWTDDFSATAITLIGLAEVVGGIGLILPLLTGIAPILTPIAATALAIIMIGAIVVHVRRKETTTPSLVLGVLSIASAVLGYLVVLG